MPEIIHTATGSGRPALPAAASEPISLSQNVLFGKYEMGKLLGCGAFAKVYHGRDVENGQSVAIKVIQKSRINNNPILRMNIKREISIMSKLRHQNVVQFLEVMATRTKIYFVLEFVKGGELFAMVAKGRFDEDSSRKFFQQLISAVGYCHGRGVYHRDLKPENMLVDDNGDLKVSDFGLSALTDHVRSDGLLHTLCGTPAYVAPEILAKKGYDGAKIDVWSCGVVLFVLTAGYLPFHDSNLMSMYRKIYRGEFRCPKWMSADLKRFLSRLLDTNPSTRITIEEIKHDPWFMKGYREIESPGDQTPAPSASTKDLEKKLLDLNAFDIISFSSGLDLSGLFRDDHRSAEYVERVTTEVAPEKVIEKVEELVKAEDGGMKMRMKKHCGVEIEGRNGHYVFELDVHRLTDEVVVVEVKRKGGDANVFNHLWNDKIRPSIARRTEILIPGN